MDYSVLIREQLNSLKQDLFIKKKKYLLLLLSSTARKIRKMIKRNNFSGKDEQSFLELYRYTNELDRNSTYRRINKLGNFIYDIKFYNMYSVNKKKVIYQLENDASGYFAIVCIVRNEARYINEWVSFYKYMGVDHIYIFNNNSTDQTKEHLSTWVKSNFVSLIDYPGEHAQMPAYRIAGKYLKDRYRWVAFIDADEFMFPTDLKLNLSDYFKSMEKYSAVGINWVVYGPNGHEMRPKGLVLENYLETFDDRNNILNLRIKSVVNPNEIYDINSPHYCILKHGVYAVDENGNKIDTKWMFVSGCGSAFTGQNSINKIRINHYWTKSKEDLAEKCNRGYATGGVSPDYINILKRIDYPQKRDDIALNFITHIRDIMQQYDIEELL